MSKKIRTEAVDYLFEAILSLKNKGECYTFFEDICTINELLSLSQRFEVAKMLRDSLNDYSMMSMDFGATVAMGNAVSELKKAAKYITKSNDELGVAYAIRELLKKQKNK